MTTETRTLCRARFAAFGRPQEGYFRRILATLVLWQERAAQRHRLADIGERQLEDMGLSRDDVRREAAKPFWRV